MAKNGEDIKSDEKESIFEQFASSTSFHGFNRVVGDQSKLRKAAWSIVIVSAFLVVTVIITLRCIKYFEYEAITSIQRQHFPELEFPAITICNYNMLILPKHVRSIARNFPLGSGGVLNAGSSADLGFGPPAFIPGDNDSNYTPHPDQVDPLGTAHGDDATTEPFFIQSTPNGYDIEYVNLMTASSFFKYGWKLIDLEEHMMLTEDGNSSYKTPLPTFLSCTFGSVKCSKRWFKPVITTRGLCYTFNHEDLEDADYRGLDSDLPLQQNVKGQRHGLSLILDIQRDLYNSEYYKSALVGIKILIHPRSQVPDMENDGIPVSPGKAAGLAFTKTKVVNIHKPWGEYDPAKKLRFSNKPYSAERCIEECRLDKIYKNCGCRLYYQTGDYPECEDEQIQNCSQPISDELDDHILEYCDCPPAKTSESYDARVSYAEILDSDEMLSDFTQQHYENLIIENATDHYRRNIASFTAYYKDVEVTIVKQMKALDELGLLSEIGGQLGLFIGTSLLTFCEVFEAIMLAVYKCRRHRAKTRASNTEPKQEHPTSSGSTSSLSCRNRRSPFEPVAGLGLKLMEP